MCVCLGLLWKAFLYVLLCQCLCQSEPEVKRTKRFRRKKKTARMSSTTRTVIDKSDLKKTSELEKDKLLDKHRVVIPNNNFGSTEDFLLANNYEILREERLGKGSFGNVFKAIRYDNIDRKGKTFVACKVMPLFKDSKKAEDSVVNEFYITTIVMSKAQFSRRSDHIITIYDIWLIEGQHERKALMFMELSELGSLSEEMDKCGAFEEAVAKRYFAHLVYAIDFLHYLNIAHRDIKLLNLLLFPDKRDSRQKIVKLTDFGLSRIHYDDETGYSPTDKTGGTHQYKAPEILAKRLNKEDQRTAFNPYKADIYAMGVCLFEMLTKQMPYKTSDDEIQFNQQVNKEYNFPDSPERPISSKVKDLIIRLLEPNPNIRLNVQQLKTHIWLKEEVSLTLSN